MPHWDKYDIALAGVLLSLLSIAVLYEVYTYVFPRFSRRGHWPKFGHYHSSYFRDKSQ